MRPGRSRSRGGPYIGGMPTPRMPASSRDRVQDIPSGGGPYMSHAATQNPCVQSGPCPGYSPHASTQGGS